MASLARNFLLQKKSLADSKNHRCQKCLQFGHWTYECQNKRACAVRPSRTQVMKKKLKEQQKIQKVDDSRRKLEIQASDADSEDSSSESDSDSSSSSSDSSSDSSSSSSSSSSNDSDSSSENSDSSPSPKKKRRR